MDRLFRQNFICPFALTSKKISFYDPILPAMEADHADTPPRGEPFRGDRAKDYRSGLVHLRDLEDVSAFIAEIEADQKGVPILLKQYLRLGGRLLGFNVDPDFSNVLDVLIMVDLRRTAPKILSRYMGRDGAQSFFAHHAHPAA